MRQCFRRFKGFFKGSPGRRSILSVTLYPPGHFIVLYLQLDKHQLHRLSLGRAANPQVHPGLALLEQQWDNRLKNRRYRHWMRRKAG